MGEYFTKDDAEEFKKDIKKYLGILAEDFQHKLGFVIDGQMDIKREVESLKQKVDTIYSELIAHRDNTEIHVQQQKRRRK